MIDHKKVRATLRSRLLAVAGIDKSNVAFQNAPFKPTEGTMYVRESYLPAEERIIATGQIGMQGIYQLDVFAPTGKKTEAAEALVKLIGDAYEPPQSIVLGGVTVTIDRAEPLPGAKNDPAWYIFPVSIRFRSYTPTSRR